MAKSLGRVEAYNLELLPINFHDPLRGKLNRLYLHLQKIHGHQITYGWKMLLLTSCYFEDY